MKWFFKPKYGLKGIWDKRDEFEKKNGNLWTKCYSCQEIIHHEELKKNIKVCPKCDYHYRLSAKERVSMLVDSGTFEEKDKDLCSTDPLNFEYGVIKYRDKLIETREKMNIKESMISGCGELSGFEVEVCAIDFNFFGGSLGVVMGEKIVRSIDRSIKHKRVLLIVSCSGGARMQEGVLSLMQMAKISCGLNRLSESKGLYISILTDPTMGGVSASFGSAGDIIIAEPKALIGFAGPRVIEQTIKQKLPAGFQRSEFLLEHGFIDLIVCRLELKNKITKLIKFFKG